MKKLFWCSIGMLGLILGAVGAVLPLIPSVPFLLLAAFSFGKSSKKLHEWFIGTKLYKKHLYDFVKGSGMTWKTKIRIMIVVTGIMAIGFICMDAVAIGRGILMGIWVFHVLYFCFGIKTKKEHESTVTEQSV